MRLPWSAIAWIPLVLLTACGASTTIDGIYTPQTQAAVRAYQATYGLSVSGQLDLQTREELKLGVDPKRGD